MHDFAGHPFQIQLSRWLAAHGHDVCHAYSLGISTPRGALTRRETDPASLKIAPISIGREINKYNILRRLVDELAYARALLKQIAREQPEVVISANASPVVQWLLQVWSHSRNIVYIYWLQDVFTHAISLATKANSSITSNIMRTIMRRIEFGALRRAAGVVAISADFKKLLSDEGVQQDRITVIENWAPTDELPIVPKVNPWSIAQDLHDKFVYMYSGTLGLKHNPRLLSSLAAHFRGNPKVRVVVITEGLGREWLEAEKKGGEYQNLILLDFVPFEDLPSSLGSADIHVVILEPEAGIFSIPSKLLTCIASEKPILGAIPVDNLAARILVENNLGENVSPRDVDGFIRAADSLYGDGLDQNRTQRLRDYKSDHFDIDKIGIAFLDVFARARALYKLS